MENEYIANHVSATISEGKWRNQIKRYYLWGPDNGSISLYVFFTFFAVPTF